MMGNIDFGAIEAGLGPQVRTAARTSLVQPGIAIPPDRDFRELPGATASCWPVVPRTSPSGSFTAC